MMEDIPGLILDAENRTVYLDGVDHSGETVTIDDCMQAGHCVRGVRRWFIDKGFDFAVFLQEGISAYDFLSTRDGHAIGIVRSKVKRQNG